MQNQTSQNVKIFFLFPPFAITMYVSFSGFLYNTSLCLFPSENSCPEQGCSAQVSYISGHFCFIRVFHQLWLQCVIYTQIFEGLEIIGRESEEQLKPMAIQNMWTFCSKMLLFKRKSRSKNSNPWPTPPLPPLVLNGGNCRMWHTLRLLTKCTPNRLKCTNKKVDTMKSVMSSVLNEVMGQNQRLPGSTFWGSSCS